MNNQQRIDDVRCPKDVGESFLSAEVALDVLPEIQTSPVEVNSQIGVSTSYADYQLGKIGSDSKVSARDTEKQWHVLRTTYGRESKAFQFLMKQKIKAFYPKVVVIEKRGGQIKKTEKSRIPNILFAYGSFNSLKAYVYDNVHEETKHLRFYYNYHHDGTKEPLIVPKRQMDSLMKICNAEEDDIQLDPFVVEKFKVGQLVRVKDGPFAGVEGIVKRYKGQQRVGIVIEELFTITTAYISKEKLELVETNIVKPNYQ